MLILFQQVFQFWWKIFFKILNVWLKFFSDINNSIIIKLLLFFVSFTTEIVFGWKIQLN